MTMRAAALFTLALCLAAPLRLAAEALPADVAAAPEKA